MQEVIVLVRIGVATGLPATAAERTQCDSDADLARPPRHGLCHHTVQTQLYGIQAHDVFTIAAATVISGGRDAGRELYSGAARYAPPSDPGVTLRVMPPTHSTLLTVEEFAKITDPPAGRYELHHDREQICFQGGCLEFWIANPVLRTIQVMPAGGGLRTYRVGDEIPLDRFAPGSVVLAEVFAKL